MAKSTELSELLAGLQELKQQARAFGIFTGDRELLACPACGLKENVAFDGVLFTCRDAALDTGMRFAEPNGAGVSCCPGCGGEVQGEWL